MTPLHLPSGRNHPRAERSLRVLVLVLPVSWLTLCFFHLIVLTLEDLILDLSPVAVLSFIRTVFFHDKDKSNMSLHWWPTLIDTLWPEVLVQSFKILPLPVFLWPLVISSLIVLLSDRPVDGKGHYYHSGFSGVLESKVKPTVVT